MTDYELTIGLEVHAELCTRSKLFCGCRTTFGEPSNTHVCPVCIGMPGVLPVMNREAFNMALRAALAFRCTVNTDTMFDRKNYYYPDLPKNYQISQNYMNLGTDGFFDIEFIDGQQNMIRKRIGITNVHLEEDAGKSLHPEDSGEDKTFIDLNRAGVPLLEIVTAPDMHSPKEVDIFMYMMRTTLLYLGVSTCRMERGELRFEASISLAPTGSDELGNRVEIKNLNSMKSVLKTLEYEIKRQTDILAGGGEVAMETLLWNEEAERSETMRSKEAAQDYRYFPEPDLVPIVLETSHIEEIKRELPEFPLEREKRFMNEYGLPRLDAEVLTADRGIADYFEETARECGDAKGASNWVMTNVLAYLKKEGIGIVQFCEKLSPKALAEIIGMVRDGLTNMESARRILDDAIDSGKPPRELLEEKGLKQISDTGELSAIIDEVLAENPQAVEDFRAGKKKASGFLVGQIMRKSKGKANPQLVNEILRRKLG